MKSLLTARAGKKEAAALWVVRMEAGLTAIENRELEKWLKEDPLHGELLVQAAQVWDKLSVLSELAKVFPLEEAGKSAGMKSRPRYFRHALAASFALAVSYVAFLAVPRSEQSQPASIRMIEPVVYQTAIGEQKAVLLADGSEVILNTNTRIEVVFTTRSRNIVLEKGEGHFKVAKDADKPFRVQTGSGVVEAVGTAFAVAASLEGKLEVIVEEGLVNFMPNVDKPAQLGQNEDLGNAGVENEPRQPMALAAGDVVSFDKASETVTREKVQPVEMENRLAWRDGMLLFEGDSLESVVRELSRYTPITIEVDEAVKNISVLGYFRTGDIDAILVTMRDTFGLEVERQSENHILLKASN
jgi:transmembrane sensor